MSTRRSSKSRLQREFGLRCWSGLPALMDQSHRHNDLELNLVEQGSVTYLFAGQRLRMSRGQMALFWAAVPHQMSERAPRTRMRWLTFPLAWLLSRGLPNTLTRPLLRGEPVVGYGRDGDAGLIAQWERDLSEAGQWPAVVMLELEARLHRLAAALLTPQARAHAADTERHVRRAELIAQVIARRFSESVTVQDIARDVNLHPNYAMTLFRQTFGVSIVEQVAQHRVAYAQQLLVTTDLGVLDIAMRAGFGSSSQFYLSFKRISGLSPRAYRRSLEAFTVSHESW